VLDNLDSDLALSPFPEQEVVDVCQQQRQGIYVVDDVSI
jgi:hypothetical protein